MTETQIGQPRSGLLTGSRWVLFVLAGLFSLGAFTQFFLVGVSFFDDASRWQDHANLGHILGLLPYVMWIPAVLGKVGNRLIVATVALLVLFGMQYAFIEADSTMMNAFHPLNGSTLLVLGVWVTLRSFGLLRQPSEAPAVRSEAIDEGMVADNLGRTTS